MRVVHQHHPAHRRHEAGERERREHEGQPSRERAPAAGRSGDAEALYRLLEDQVVPTYYQRDERGIPHAWLRIVKECIRTVTPQFCATRMIKEYVKEMYVPAAQQAKDSGASKVSR